MNVFAVILQFICFCFWASFEIKINKNFELKPQIQSYSTSLQSALGTNGENIEKLLDSKSENNLIGFLSSSTLSNIQIGLQKDNILHFTLMQSSSSLSTLVQGYIPLSKIISENVVFYNSKIVTLNPLSILINYSNNKTEQSSDSKHFIHLIKLNNLLDVENDLKYYFSTNCVLFLTDVKVGLNDNFFMLTIEDCISSSMFLTLIKCDMLASDLTINCKPNQYTSMSSDSPNFLLSSKLITFNSSYLNSVYKEFVYVGLSYSSSTGDPCSNSIKFAEITPSFNIMDPVFVCSDYPIKTYTRFTFLLYDQYLINIGTKCSELDLTCINDYISLYIYDLYDEYFPKYKVKVNLNDQIAQISDAILSPYSQERIYILANLTDTSPILGIYTIDAFFSTIGSSITAKRILDLTDFISCRSFYEFSILQFVLHCISLLSNSASPGNVYQIEKFYIVQSIDNNFRAIITSANYDMKAKSYTNVYSYLTAGTDILLLINNYFSFNFLLYQKSDWIKIEFDSEYEFIVANSFTYVSSKLLLLIGGCGRKNSLSNLEGLIKGFDGNYASSNNYILSFKESIEDYIESMLLKDDKTFIASMKASNASKTYFTKLLLITIKDTSLEIVRQSISLQTYQENIPIIMNSLRQILLVSGGNDTSDIPVGISLNLFGENLEYIGPTTYNLLKNNYILEIYTMLFNPFDDNKLEVGGSIFVKSFPRYFIGHLNLLLKNIDSYNFEGQNTGKALTSVYLNKRIQSFSGFINRIPPSNSLIGASTGVPFVVYLTENGTYIAKDEIFLEGGLFTSSIQLKDSLVGYYGHLMNSSIIKYEILISVECPKNSIIDEIEYGCIESCITVMYPIDAFKCNPFKKGCNPNGKLNPGYQCVGNSRIQKIKYKANSKDQKATMYSPNEILFTINDTINTSSTNIYIMIKQNRIPRLTTNFIIEDHDNYFSELYIKLTNFSELFCLKSILIDFSKMNLRNDEGATVYGKALYVSNLDILPCKDKNSQLSEIIISNSSVVMNKLSAISVGSSLASFNPISIIALLNCINELTLFQLINFGKNYPNSLNAFFNTTTAFSFDFLPNFATIFINTSNVAENSWFDNNIGNNNDIQSASFLINVILLFPVLLGGLSAFLFAELLFQYGFVVRNFRSYFSINFLISFSQGMIYKILIICLAGIFFDNANSDYFSFISGIFSYIFFSSQFLLLIFYSFLIIRYRKSIEYPEIESFMSALYEDVQITPYSSITSLLFKCKLQILLCLSFILQNWGNLQISSFILVYVFCLISRFFACPSTSCVENIQLFIKDFLFLLLTSFCLVFKIMIYLKNNFYETLQDIMLINIVVIILNEFLFSILGLILLIIDTCREEKVRVKSIQKFRMLLLKCEEIKNRCLMNRNLNNNKPLSFCTLQCKKFKRLTNKIYNKSKLFLKSEKLNYNEKVIQIDKFQKLQDNNPNLIKKIGTSICKPNKLDYSKNQFNSPKIPSAREALGNNSNVKEVSKNLLDVLPHDIEYFRAFEKNRVPLTMDSPYFNNFNILNPPNLKILNPNQNLQYFDSISNDTISNNSDISNLNYKLTRLRATSQKEPENEITKPTDLINLRRMSPDLTFLNTKLFNSNLNPNTFQSSGKESNLKTRLQELFEDAISRAQNPEGLELNKIEEDLNENEEEKILTPTFDSIQINLTKTLNKVTKELEEGKRNLLINYPKSSLNLKIEDTLENNKPKESSNQKNVNKTESNTQCIPTSVFMENFLFHKNKLN